MPDLDEFLKAAKSKGASDQFLVALLREKGWPSKQVYESLERYYVEQGGVAIPESPSRLESAREAFFHLLAFATLGAWVFALGSTWFELINHWIPDLAMPRHYYSPDFGLRRIAWEMSATIVAFPAFVVATLAVLRDMEANPDKADSGIRRWLTNLALLITALIFIGDLVSFLTSFLQGELTTRFVLKSLTVCVLAVAVFLYYVRGLNRGPATTPLWHRHFALAAGAAILLTLTLGFSVFGSPGRQRLLAEDRRRLNDLHQIAARFHDWWAAQPTDSRALPEKWPPDFTASRRDPFSGADYEYERAGPQAYRLCAAFNLPSSAPSWTNDRWHHNAGRQCFNFSPNQAPPAPY